ncbi:hypothetical protein JVT61DRAFT_7633 [Boletus reticuloceps]|uniref:Uncharacterized protein n=1 Tax=Boletus reticuloceps TaxID=495285 RepID=A0A8I2YIK3_9AGAM|nr:hypothetical protein JVT61DRAFT_7633 [Boletus reticuloceps]
MLLGHCFKVRSSFERLGELSDIEVAISTLKDAVDLTPLGHPDKPGCLNNLGSSFGARFARLGELSDLEDAISTHRDAVDLVPRGHPDKPLYLNSLGISFRDRFEHLGKLSDLEDAISTHGARSFPQLAWVGLSLKHRYTELKQGADVVRDAAAAALDAGLPETAVEWLEQGRLIVWESLLQLRSSYEELSAAHPDHARRLRELSAALDNAGATRERAPSALSEQTQESLQQVADRHRMLAIERDKLLQEIRRFPGFERFLLQKDFSQLRAAAHSGLVVITNAAESRCDALVVLADVDHVIHVPLPKFNLRRSAGLQNMLGKLLGHARDTVLADRKGGQATRRGFSWESLLSTLWNGVIKPVLDALAPSTRGVLSRIFWCPSGPFVFLPIHAAGLYDTQHSSPGHNVFDSSFRHMSPLSASSRNHPLPT